MNDDAQAPLQRQIQRERTARKEAERLLEERSQALYRTNQSLQRQSELSQSYLDTMQTLMIALDRAGRITMINRAGCALLGLSEQALLGQAWFERFVPQPMGAEVVLPQFQRFVSGEREEAGELSEYPVLCSNGQQRLIAWRNALLTDKAGQVDGVLSSGDDVTERRQAETARAQANRALTSLSAVNHALVHAGNEGELLQRICEAIVAQRGYSMAWVGYKQDDADKSIKIMARAGNDEGYLDALQLSWAQSEHGMGVSGRAIRSGATQCCQNIATDPHYSLWREAALQRAYAACIALPLAKYNGEVFGILHVYACEVNAFSSEEIALLEEMADDLAFGVRSLHVRSERDLAYEQIQQQLQQLQSSLDDTVRAIATIVEMRDPYTSGHQLRVADLAQAIARQLGLPDDQVRAIHLAGVLHDLGKIQIPAEILAKPGKLSEIEFGLIKTHPQTGFEILKGIAFPWPIAQMVLQHHERLDGSGYPQGLKGDQIILGARILSVADVVEAISAHRPYRPGLGLDVALAEISKLRGIHFDPLVVDACLALFGDQPFQFTERRHHSRF
jgi:PAS domain S-box-containing protein/putative nucleotidyltransferase with HDIG domain